MTGGRNCFLSNFTKCNCLHPLAVCLSLQYRSIILKPPFGPQHTICYLPKYSRSKQRLSSLQGLSVRDGWTAERWHGWNWPSNCVWFRYKRTVT